MRALCFVARSTREGRVRVRKGGGAGSAGSKGSGGSKAPSK